ncbi:hypothetical protein PABG_07276 [Paracoccidioides brasiliensis Pb03]|nr:hypothetical protein PABG_07276 [Paracoccidioides brasiliensis Pb03]
MGTNFCNDLGIHRTVEKEIVFPHLGQRMPEFTEKHSKMELLAQDELIHEGLVRLQGALQNARKDDEVFHLVAANMRKFWSLEDIKNMPFYSRE